jgi:hypothetical protein
VIVLLSYFVCDCSQNKTQQELIADDRIGFSRGLSELYRRALLVFTMSLGRDIRFSRVKVFQRKDL